MGDHIARIALTEIDALLAALFAARAILSMPSQDAPAILAIVVIVIYISMLGRILQ